MKIIGHRGAGRLAAENSLSAIRAARIMGVDAMEIDVRVTKDNRLVVFHDKRLLRMAGRSDTINSLSQEELTSIKLKNGTTIPTLEEAFEVAQDVPFFIEGKASGWAKPLAKSLKDYKFLDTLTVISFNEKELAEFGKLMPGVRRHILRFNSLSAIRLAVKYNFTGINVLFWSMNPLIYHLAKHRKLNVEIFSANKTFIRLIYKLAVRFYPSSGLTTNYPDRLIGKDITKNGAVK